MSDQEMAKRQHFCGAVAEEILVSELDSLPVIAPKNCSPSPSSERRRLKARGRTILGKQSKTENFSNARCYFRRRKIFLLSEDNSGKAFYQPLCRIALILVLVVLRWDKSIRWINHYPI